MGGCNPPIQGAPDMMGGDHFLLLWKVGPVTIPVPLYSVTSSSSSSVISTIEMLDGRLSNISSE